jgi:acetyl esterase/lipase
MVLMASDDSPIDPEALAVQVREEQKHGPTLPSAAFRSRFEVQLEQIDGQLVLTTKPMTNASNKLRILYLHGGGYVGDVAAFHWDIAEQLMDRTGATIVMPAYPLAPEHDWQPAHQMVKAEYNRLVGEVGARNLVIAGDSAGGGFALAVAQQLRDEKRPLPAALVLFSPWLDVTLSDPTQPELDKRDPFLSRHSLVLAGRWWAGDLPTTDPRISPLFGSVAGLPPLVVFTGTEDLLNPDAHRLAVKAEASGARLTLLEYPHQPHVWMATSPGTVPEAVRALEQASMFILEHAGRQ